MDKSRLVHDLTNGISEQLQQKRAALRDFITAYKLRPALMKELQLLVEKQPRLLVGDHHWRTISENGTVFNFPLTIEGSFASVIAFSRIANHKEILCAINLHTHNYAVIYVTLESSLHPSGSRLQCLHNSAPSPRELNVEDRNGKAVRLSVPPQALVIYG